MTIAALLVGTIRADGDMVTTSLGNTSSGFSDGDTPFILLVAAAQSGQPAPFDQGYGIDPAGPDFAVNWTFNYAAPAGPISGASITVGVLDHDSASPGSQLALFNVDGTNVTPTLDTAFEAHGGASGEYNVYTVPLPGSAFANLADGSAPVSLTLQGPVETIPLFGGDPVVEDYNGAHILFSTLEITYVPEPATVVLLTMGVYGLVSGRWRRKGA